MTRLRLARPILALATALALTAPARAADGTAGPYLAARYATFFNDYTAAATYFTRALAHDGANPMLMENALLAQIGRGDIKTALPIAEQMREGGIKNQIADLALLAGRGEAGAYDEALKDIEAGNGAGPLIDGLYKAWAYLGLGQMSEAAEAFDKVAEEQGLTDFALYHKALAFASAGDFEGADHILSGETGTVLQVTRRGVIAHAEVLSQLERNPDAIELLDKVFGSDPDPGIAAIRARLEAGETLPFTLISGARDGLAEVFYTVAGALSGEASDGYTLIYARLAEYLRPGHADAVLLLARILEEQGQYDLATEAYNRIPRDDAAFYVAELGRADALVEAGRTEAAIEVLEQLARAVPKVALVHTTLGDTLRRIDRYREAGEAYDRAVALFDKDDPSQWVVYYARAICNEREKRWPEAEADFKKALELKPDQPQVLNYLGYSYLEMNTNLEEALGMIERAVAARPNDGYITDSLGWALYRLGRYEEAVKVMEQAVELMAVDSTVNDHLGDVYWAVGRKREAEYQWRRALSFGPETEETAERIRHKLADGLDAVLAGEGAAPLAVTKNGD